MKQLQIKGNKIYAPLKDKWLIVTPEERVRQNFIQKLINHYGYSLDQMSQEESVSNSQRGQGRARADIVIWKNAKEKQEKKKAFIVIECKAENVAIKEEDYFQGLNYAVWAGAIFFVTTNEKTNKAFKVNQEKIPNKLDEIIDIPKAKDINNQSKIDKILSQTKTFTRDEFTKLLHNCHNIIRNNDKLSPEAAFDEISKILFIKIRYERNPDEDMLFSLDHFEKEQKKYENEVRKNYEVLKNVSYIQNLFNTTKIEFAKDDLFDKNDSIKIKQYSFEQIVKKLEKYNLSNTSDDIKGIAFENFLGKTFRGELGQFFTPRPVVDFMTAILDPVEGETICDPTCGSGGFLIKAFEYIREEIEKDIQKQKEIIKQSYLQENLKELSESRKEENSQKVNNLITKLNEDLNLKDEESRLNKLSANSIFGTDANPRMARTSKMNMIMHGDGHSGLHHNDGLLNINGIFEDRFDVILTNPPFGARVDKSIKITENDKYTDQEKIKYYTEKYKEKYTKALNQVNSNIDKTLLSLFEVGKFSGLTEVLFTERCLKLLKKGGRMGIVLPEGVLNNSNLQKVRDYFEGKAKILLIASIPQDVFMSAKATVKPSLVFLKKFTKEEEKQYNKIQEQSEKEVKENYSQEIENIKNSDLTKKEQNKKLKEIESKITEETKAKIKEKLNYQIPIAEVKQAGITKTGNKCKNELLDVLQEFSNYRKDKKLWQNPAKAKISYKLVNGDIKKIIEETEEEKQEKEETEAKEKESKKGKSN